MLRKRKLFVRPKKAFESARIKEENSLVKKYALKNKREIWKTLAKANYFRRRAKDLVNSSKEEQENFFSKLRALGLNAKNTADVLDLRVENLLERRLSTIVSKKKIATTPKQARQMIVHKKILVDGKVVNIPSYIVPVSLEGKIQLKKKKAKQKVKEKAEQETPIAEETKAPQEQSIIKEESPVQTEVQNA